MTYNFNGFDYIMLTMQFEQIIPYGASSVNFVNEIKPKVKDLISSDAVQVVICEDKVHQNLSTVFTKKGEMFKINVAAVDQVGNAVNATIISSVLSPSGIGRLKEGQTDQRVEDQCTEIEYNVYSLDNSAQVHLYADGPCINLGISKQTINVSFLPCTCPIGFQPTTSEIDCLCDCDQRLKDY